MGVYSDLDSHRRMVFDAVRNRAYARAIAEAITPGCRVLDLGAGLGMHGLLAAVAGAGEVILLDSSPVVELAADLASANGVADRVKVVRKRAEDAEIRPPVDLLISVFTGNFLLTEDLLPALFGARDRFLRPGGTMLPSCARMHVALVSAPEFFDERVARWSEPASGIDFAPVRKLAANSVHYAAAQAIGGMVLGEPAQLLELNLRSCRSADCRGSIELRVERDGTCHGVLGWFDIALGGEWLSTGPVADPTHWSLAFLPLDPPLLVRAGQVVRFELDRPEFGEWTWTVVSEHARQRHSTFNGRRVDVESLKRQRADYVPGLGDDGSIALCVLELMQRGRNISEIVDAVQQSFPSQCERDAGLAHRVRELIERWAAR